MPASLTLRRRPPTPATLLYGRKNIGKLKGYRKGDLRSPLIRKCQRTGGCRSRAALPPPLLSHVLYPPITHEYSRTLGRSPACTNSRRAPCRTPCDETQTPFERALPPPGIQRFDRARILTNFRPHIGLHKLTTGPVSSPQYACYYTIIYTI